jgi:hypothetical protein
VLLGCIACEFDAVLKPTAYPMVETLEPVVDSDGVLLKACIRNRGTEPFLRYGFAWGMVNDPTIDNQHYLIDGNLVSDSFSIKISDGLASGDYWIRSFVETEAFESYSVSRHFSCTYSSKPTLTDFHPKRGFAGDTIVIEGKNLMLGSLETSVCLGDLPVPIVSGTSERLLVKVPQRYSMASGRISVTVGDLSCISAESYTIQYEWTQKKSLNLESSYEPVSFSSDTKGYLIQRLSSTYIEYNPVDDTWLRRNLPMNSGGQIDYSLPDTTITGSSTNETALLAFSAGKKAYVFLSGVFWEFNTETNVWNRRALFPGILEKENRSVFGVFVNGKLYLGNCGARSDFWEYDPASNSWSRKADFKTSFPNLFNHGNSVFNLGKKLYLAVTTDNYICKLHIYEPISNTWSAKGNLPYLPWMGQACFVLDDVAYVGLGQSLNSDRWRFIKYDVSTDSWSDLSLHPNMGNTIVDAVFPINGKAFWIIPNWIYESICEIWEYDPVEI